MSLSLFSLFFSLLSPVVTFLPEGYFALTHKNTRIQIFHTQKLGPPPHSSHVNGSGEWRVLKLTPICEAPHRSEQKLIHVLLHCTGGYVGFVR